MSHGYLPYSVASDENLFETSHGLGTRVAGAWRHRSHQRAKGEEASIVRRWLAVGLQTARCSPCGVRFRTTSTIFGHARHMLVATCAHTALTLHSHSSPHNYRVLHVYQVRLSLSLSLSLTHSLTVSPVSHRQAAHGTVRPQSPKRARGGDLSHRASTLLTRTRSTVHHS